MVPKIPATIKGLKSRIAPAVGRQNIVYDKPNVSANDSTKKIKTPIFVDNGVETIIEKLDVSIGKWHVLVCPNPGIRKGIVRNIVLLKGGGLLDCVGGVDGYLAEDCKATTPISQLSFINGGGRGGIDKPNNMTLRRLYCPGAINEHVCRFHNFGLLIAEDVIFLNPRDAVWANKKGASLNIRDGVEARISGKRKDGKSTTQLGGQVIAGPLADQDGGFTDFAKSQNQALPKKQRDAYYAEFIRKMSLRTKLVSFESVDFVDAYGIAEAGLEELVLKDVGGTIGGGGGYFFSIEGEYGHFDGDTTHKVRPPLKKLTVEDVHLTSKAKKPFAGAVPKGFMPKNSTWNGKDMRKFI